MSKRKFILFGVDNKNKNCERDENCVKSIAQLQLENDDFSW